MMQLAVDIGLDQFILPLVGDTRIGQICFRRHDLSTSPLDFLGSASVLEARDHGAFGGHPGLRREYDMFEARGIEFG